MRRKEIKSKLLMGLMAVSAIVTGIMGSVPLPVKAAEEGTYTVTFDANEGTCEAGSISVPRGESLTLPEAFYEGHYLLSWMDAFQEGNVFKQKSVGGAGCIYTPERDLWLYASWMPEITVTYIYNGGKGEAGSNQVISEAEYTLPEAGRENYNFLGWYEDEALTVFAGNAGEKRQTPQQDITYYAAWEKTHATIIFDVADGKLEGGDTTARIGDTITLPVCIKDGHEFIGWYIGSICIGQAGDEYTISDDVTLEARFIKEEAPEYTISFDADGGKEIAPVKAVEGERINLPVTERSGYRFLGWYTEKDGGTLLGIAGDQMEVTKDVTVYALWEKAQIEKPDDEKQEIYKAVFHAEGGKLEKDTVAAAKGASLYLPLPERKGYSFKGWYLDRSLTQFAGDHKDVYHITRNIDFYAKWEKTGESITDQGSIGETAMTYIVKYDANGGTTKAPYVKVVKGARLTLPAAERKGYVFKGWYTDNQVFIGMDGDTYKPGRDISLYAGWEKESGTEVENGLDANAGSSANSGEEKKEAASVEGADQKIADTSERGLEKEPVLQTGRISPVWSFMILGMAGILLVALSVRGGKHALGK